MSTRQPTTIDTTGINVTGMAPGEFSDDVIDAVRYYVSRRDMLKCDTALEHAAAACTGSDVYQDDLLPVFAQYGEFSDEPTDADSIEMGIRRAADHFRENGEVPYRAHLIPVDVDEMSYRFGWRLFTGLPLRGSASEAADIFERFELTSAWVFSRAEDIAAARAAVSGGIYIADRYVDKIDVRAMPTEDGAPKLFHVMGIHALDNDVAEYAQALAFAIGHTPDHAEEFTASLLEAFSGPQISSIGIKWGLLAGVSSPSEIEEAGAGILDPMTCIGHVEDGRVDFRLHVGQWSPGDSDFPSKDDGFADVSIPQMVAMV